MPLFSHSLHHITIRCWSEAPSTREASAPNCTLLVLHQEWRSHSVTPRPQMLPRTYRDNAQRYSGQHYWPLMWLMPLLTGASKWIRVWAVQLMAVFPQPGTQWCSRNRCGMNERRGSMKQESSYKPSGSSAPCLHISSLGSDFLSGSERPRRKQGQGWAWKLQD